MLDSHGKLRRSIVRGVAATSLAAGAWISYRAIGESVFSGGMGEAYDPWKRWREADRIRYDLALSKYEPNAKTERAMASADPRIDFIQAAELASSTLNSQPWKFQLTPDFINVFGDIRRQLTVLDPNGTELLIALGAALQNLALAASAAGYRMDRMGQVSGPGTVARVRFESTGRREESPLYEAIPHCHDHYGSYDRLGEFSPGLSSEFQGLPDSGKVHLLMLAPETTAQTTEVVKGTVRQIATDSSSMDEIHRWFRQTRESIYLSRDGINVDTFGLPLIEKIALKIGPKMSPERLGEFLVEHADRVYSGDQTFGLIALNGEGSPEDYLEAGRLWQKLRLWAQSKGMAVHSLNQSISGALDRTLRGGSGETRLELHQFLQQFTAHPVICWRMGTPQRQSLPGPRRSLAETITT